jgi:hypothetical protein
LFGLLAKLIIKHADDTVPEAAELAYTRLLHRLRLPDLLRLVGHGHVHILSLLVDLLHFFLFTFGLLESLLFFFEFLVSLVALQLDLLADVLEVRLPIEQLQGALLHTQPDRVLEGLKELPVLSLLVLLRV